MVQAGLVAPVPEPVAETGLCKWAPLLCDQEQADGIRRYVPKKPQVGAIDQNSEGVFERPEKVRQTLHLPAAVHDQLRDLAHRNRTSQQKLIRRALNLLFAGEQLPTWEELEPPKKR